MLVGVCKGINKGELALFDCLLCGVGSQIELPFAARTRRRTVELVGAVSAVEPPVASVALGNALVSTIAREFAHPTT